MTAEEWDVHYWRVRLDLVRDGIGTATAAHVAEQDTTEQFGPRPREAL